MKFVTFLKIFAICFFSLVGTFAAGFGVMYLAGSFTEPEIKPTDLAFEFSEYNVDGDFTVKVTTTTSDVTLDAITLNLVTSAKVDTLSDGRITDGVIIIPKTAKIGEEIQVELHKTVNDTEAGGQTWITGGHSKISATSTNNLIEPATTDVNVDVPVYRVEVVTKADEADAEFNDTFVLASEFYAGLKFYPARSAYQYSKDGTVGTGEVVYKNAYFVALSTTNNEIEQVGKTNAFSCLKIGNDIKITGYAFTTAKIEENVVALYQDKSEETKFSLVLDELKNMVNDNSQIRKSAVMAEGSVNVVDIDVDTIEFNGEIKDIYVDSETTFYASREVLENDLYASNLDIELSSTQDPTVSLQSKLKNVAIRFEVKVGANNYDATDNANNTFNVIQMISGGYSKKIVRNGKTYYLPVATANAKNAYWKFVATKKCDPDSLIAIVEYLTDGDIVSNISDSKSFSTKSVASSPISWKQEYIEETLNLKIYDSSVESQIEYEEFNLSDATVVPSTNLHQTKKYFAYTEDAKINLKDIIYCNEKQTYTLGTQSTEYDLYEIPDGVVKAKGTNAHDKSFKVLFVTVETDYQGSIKLENGKYVINQFAQTELGTISMLNFYISKTLKNISSVLEPNQESTIFAENMLAYVQGTTSAFDITVSPTDSKGSTNDVENSIFKKAIEDGDISVVARIGDTETDLVKTITINTDTIGEGAKAYTICDFSMQVGDLPAGNKSSIVELYVKYRKSETVTEYYKITQYNDAENAKLITFENGIEIYDGSAEKFAFALSSQPNLSGNVNTTANRIVVSSNITGQTTNDGSPSLVTNITTSYMLGGVDVAQYLFEVDYSDVTNPKIDTTKIAILLQDKYGRTPLNTSYLLRSANQKVMLVSKDAVTFVASGNAELELTDGSGNVKDTLYFTSVSAGQITEVKKFEQTVDKDGQVVNALNDYYKFDEELNNAYDFTNATINVIGYEGLKLFFNSSLEAEVNLMQYFYTDASGKVFDLTGKVQYSYEEGLEDRYKNYITFGANSITFEKDFGQKTTFNLVAEVKELGLIQTIVIAVEPNVTISVSPSYNSETSIVDINRYGGVYAESEFTVTGTMEVKTNSSDDTAYGFFIKGENDTNYVRLVKQGEDGDTSKGYIISDNSTFQRKNGDLLVNLDVTIVFNSVEDFEKVILLFRKITLDTEVENTYDASSVSYIYLNPNVKIDNYADEVLYLETINVGEVYGTYDLNNAVSLSKILGVLGEGGLDTTINGNITYSLDENSTQKFSISGSILNCISGDLSIDTQVKVAVYYNGYNVREGATLASDGKYYITLTFAPNIIPSETSTAFVIYNGEKYLKLINGQPYTFDYIKSQFTDDAGNALDILHIELGVLDSDYASNESEEGFTIQGMSDRINTEYSVVVTLKNGHSKTYKTILLPDDVPFVNYGVSNDEINDLANILSEDWLIANKEKYAFELAGAGSVAGTKIVFTKDELVSGEQGILEFNSGIGVAYSVKNVDENDLFSYAEFRVDSSNLYTMAVGTDKYVLVNYKLSQAQGALVIPYIIHIRAELQLNVYYPYANGVSTNDNQTPIAEKQFISTPNFDMEYLSFDNSSTPKAVINFNEVQSETIPNRAPNDEINSWNSYRRFKVVNKYDDTKTIEQVSYTYEVDALYTQQNNFSGWTKQTLIGDFVNITNGVLTVYQRQMKCLRLRIKVSTENGITGYYYVSCGEVPDYVLSQAGAGIIIDNITLTAGTTDTTTLATYSLTSANQMVNYTKYLKFYAPNYLTIDKDLGTIEVVSSIKDLKTKFVFYTIYGQVKMIDVAIQSTYKLNSYESEELYSGQSGLDLKSGITIYNTNTEMQSSEWSITNIAFEDESPNYIKINDNKTLDVGIVDVKTTLALRITTDIQDAVSGEYYEFTYYLNLLPVLEVEEENALNNPMAYEEVEAKQDAVINLDDLFNVLDNEKDFTSFASVGQFSVELLTGSAAISSITVGPNAEPATSQILLTTKLVANDVVVSVKVTYTNYNFAGDEATATGFSISAYAVFTISPNFTMTISYPKAREDGGDLENEKFYIGTSENPLEFSLIGTPLVGINPRVNIVEKTSNTNSFFVTISQEGTGTVFVNDIVLNSTTQYNLSDTFKFKLGPDAQSAHIIFNFLVKDGTENVNISQTYSLYLYSNIQNVYETKNNNINTEKQSSVNSVTNPETIYVGDNDKNLFNVVKVFFSLDQKITEPKYAKMYFGDIEITSAGIIKFDTTDGGGTVTKSKLVNLPDLSKCQITDTFNFKFVNAEGELSSADQDIYNITFVKVISRLELYYKGESNEIVENNKVDFLKTYNVLLSKVQWDNSKIEGSLEDVVREVNVSITPDETDLTIYEVNYVFDVAFVNTKLEIENNQSVSIVNKSQQFDDKQNYITAFGMIKSSNRVAYSQDMFTADGLEISIEKVENILSNGNYSGISGYITYEAYYNAEDIIYDFLLIAHGAPNDPVTVKLTFQVKLGNVYKQFVLELVVEHDYEVVSLTNAGKDTNTSSNPFIIVPDNFTNDSCTVVFAYKDVLDVNGNLIYILHKNNPIVNAASQFNVTLDGDTSYATVLTNSTDLTVRFKKATFGNKNISLTLSDNYGYVCEYYIQIQAEANPEYNKGQITVYESDTLEIATETTQTASADRISVVLSAIESDKIEDLKKNGTIQYKLQILHNNEYVSQIEGIDYNFYENGITSEGKINIMPQALFETSISVKAQIVLILTDESEETCTLYIPVMLVQRYTVSQNDSEKFVRDGQEFSLLDVVKYTDNKSKVNFGERSLTDVHSIYIKPNLNLTASAAKIDSYMNVSFALEVISKEDSNSSMQFPMGQGKELFEKTSATNLSAYYYILEDIQGTNLNTELYTYSLVYFIDNGLSEEQEFLPVYALDSENNLTGKKLEISSTSSTGYFTIGEGEDAQNYYFDLQLVNDQKLSIGTRRLSEDANVIPVYFDNGSVLFIPLDSNATKTYSLMQKGIISQGNKTSLKYGTFESKDSEGNTTNTLIINGLSTDSLQKLLGITFQKNGVDTQGKDILNLDAELSAKDVELGIKYLPKTVTYKLFYEGASSEGIYKDIEYKVTLKYVGVNTFYAYGASNMKTLFVPKTNADSNNKLVVSEGSDGYEVSPINWAGMESNSNVLKLYPGYNSVAQLATNANEDLTLVSYSDANNGWILKNNLSIQLNTAGTNNALVSVSGNSIIFKEGYDIDNNHVMIDVSVTYADGQFSEKIGSVVFGLSIFNTDGASMTYKNEDGRLIFVDNTDGAYKLTRAEILKAIVIRSANGTSYNGQDIHDLFKPTITVSYDAAEPVVLDGENEGYNEQVEITKDTTTIKVSLEINNTVIKIDKSSNALEFTLTSNKYTAVDYNTDLQLNFVGSVDDVKDKIQTAIYENVKFVDNYGMSEQYYKGKDNIKFIEQIPTTSNVLNYGEVGIYLSTPETKTISEYGITLYYMGNKLIPFENILTAYNVEESNVSALKGTIEKEINSEQQSDTDENWSKSFVYSYQKGSTSGSVEIDLSQTYAILLQDIQDKIETNEETSEQTITKYYSFDISELLGDITISSLETTNLSTDATWGWDSETKTLISQDFAESDLDENIFGSDEDYIILKVRYKGTSKDVSVDKTIYLIAFKSNAIQLDFVFETGETMTNAIGDLLTYVSIIKRVDKSKLSYVVEGSSNVQVVYDNNQYRLVLNKDSSGNFATNATISICYVVYPADSPAQQHIINLMDITLNIKTKS